MFTFTIVFLFFYLLIFLFIYLLIFLLLFCFVFSVIFRCYCLHLWGLALGAAVASYLSVLSSCAPCIYWEAAHSLQAIRAVWSECQAMREWLDRRRMGHCIFAGLLSVGDLIMRKV